MRLPFLFGLAAALLALALAAAPPVSAQDDGCTETNPCVLDVEVDVDGIATVSVNTFTSGDWYRLTVSNLDAADHSVSIEGHAVSVRVEGDLYNESEPFRFAGAGTYELRDQPTGDTAELTVTAEDSLGGEDGDGDAETNDTSVLAVGLTLSALMAAILRRRN